MKKLKQSRGETLVETLVSLLIAVLSFGILATSVVTAARINAKTRAADVSFRYEAEDVRTAAVQLTGRAGRTTGDVAVYENNGYYYYAAGEGTAP